MEYITIMHDNTETAPTREEGDSFFDLAQKLRHGPPFSGSGDFGDC